MAHLSLSNSSETANDNESYDTSNDYSLVGIEEKVCLILLYSIILLLAIVGNMLVIITLAVNKRMRTVTNVFLMNLAISDLLLGVFCMPFTLAGALLREFVFGEAMCRMIPYFQAVSVSVSAWTLVAMSVERYYAICHPLKSREWQTLSHANRMIWIVWAGSFICMLPIAILSELQPIRDSDGENPSPVNDRQFLSRKTLRSILVRTDPNSPSSSSSCVLTTDRQTTREANIISVQAVTNPDRSLSQKRRVIKMLFVVVLEFFLCWSPIYVLNTITLFYPVVVYQGLGYYGISFFHLLAYTSSCCNPITYCFMNSKFRENFKAIFSLENGKAVVSTNPEKDSIESVDTAKEEAGINITKEFQ
ncbi:cholecystokinin receptor type A-like [Limulus polyphemus]|uniref:Cholecystokinin receptor type A-like n=1 Tax=Limulus polyphemus TaxID=6850 RepID=A0ABM1TQT0_LIMPO|nr:cholecystokinin receptor type A-like [Limulus polyphemus]